LIRLRRKYKKEYDILRAVEAHQGCWVSARFVKGNINFRSKIPNAISAGKILSRIGFKKRNDKSSAPNEFYIDKETFQKRHQILLGKQLSPPIEERGILK